MSRVGKMPVTVPQGWTWRSRRIRFRQGQQRALVRAANALVAVKHGRRHADLRTGQRQREAGAMSGTMRQLVNNMVNGVSKGFEKKLT
jgi:large subunit ribosomal protein L6